MAHKDNRMSVVKSRYSFHSRAGLLAEITNEGLTATRKHQTFNAVLIGNQPLKDGKMFEVRIEGTVSSWQGSIAVGCTTSSPDTVSLPTDLSVSFQQDSWIYASPSKNNSILKLVKHGRQQINEYGKDLNSLEIGDTVGIARVGRKLKFYVNGIDQGTAEDNLPPTVYPMVDLYGKCTQVSIVLPGELLFTLAWL